MLKNNNSMIIDTLAKKTIKNNKKSFSVLFKVYPMSRTIKLKGIFLMLKI